MSPRRWLCGLALLALALVCVSTPAVGLSPNPGSWCYVQLQFVEISKIDGVEQAFHADFYMLTTWAVDNSASPLTVSSDLNSGLLDQYYWAPLLEFINARDQTTRLVDNPFGFVRDDALTFDLAIARPGWSKPANYLWVSEDQRYQCDFTTPLKMEDFPYDSQYMQLLIESYWDASQVTIHFASPNQVQDMVPDWVSQNIVGWTYKKSRFFDGCILYPYNKRIYHRLTVRTLLQREPQFYLTKIVSGSVLLVLMCIWVFALAVDEADRMMGTLQIFAGLITFLFVAGGDTPKVPYQTRLDVFMMWCFMVVALILFIHGALYYWRECDVEDLLEEREKQKQEEEKAASGVPAQHEIEMGVAQAAGGRVYVNDHNAQAVAAAAVEPIPSKWRLRHDEWDSFNMKKWFLGLHLTRKVDAICVPGLFIVYTIGVAVILGRAVAETPSIDEVPTVTCP